MRGSKQDIPVAFEGMGIVLREAEWGDMNVALESFPAGADSAPVFRGLPDDRCQCPHWGYVVSGQLRVRYKDHDEVLVAGYLYYLPSGHTTVFEQATTVFELSPK